ncbi:MAG: hypothetical protein ACJAX4_001710 [Clostridium sp.]|jgi:hypothetical protein
MLSRGGRDFNIVSKPLKRTPLLLALVIIFFSIVTSILKWPLILVMGSIVILVDNEHSPRKN